MPSFNTRWDEACWHEGPPAIFIIDHKAWIKVDPERTREMWLLLGTLPRQTPSHWVLTDEKTGLSMYIGVTNDELAEKQVRGRAERFESLEAALSAVDAQWKKKRRWWWKRKC